SHGDADWLPDYEDWLGEQFSDYSFHPDGTLNVSEALAESYAAVEHNRAEATEGERALHALLRQRAREGNDVDPRFDPGHDSKDGARTSHPEPSGDRTALPADPTVPTAREIAEELGDAASIAGPDR